MKSETESLKSQIRFLQIAICILSVLFLGFAVMFYSGASTFKEIDVERINIREKSGVLKMVISNKTRQHPGRINGKDIDPREREAGLIFFNGDGDECGGLVYDNDKKSAGMVYSVDKYLDDQVMQLQYAEDLIDRKRKYGLQFWTYDKEDAMSERYDRYKSILKMKDKSEQDKAISKMKEEGLLSTDRMFIGKSYENELGLFIRDSKGNVRIKIYVDQQDNPVIECNDAAGNSVPVNTIIKR